MKTFPPAILECAAFDLYESLRDAVAETNTALMSDPKPARPKWLDNAEEILLKMEELAKKYQPIHPEPEDPKYPY